MLNGRGILMPSDEGKDIIGFFTTRAVRASSAEEAVVKTKASVAKLWATEYREINKGAAPILITEEVEEIGFWRALKILNKGHVFYTAE
jgi:hypothetical protein